MCLGHLGAVRTLEPYTGARPAESPIGDQSGTQVFRVMRDASRCDVAAFGIADDRPVPIRSIETLAYIVRNMRRRIGLEYLCQRDSPLSRWLAPGKISPAADDD